MKNEIKINKEKKLNYNMLKISASFLNKFEEKIKQGMEKHNILGLAIGLIDETGVIWGKGYGFTNNKKNHPVDLDTVFPIGSCSKAYTALAFLIGLEKGYFKLQDKLIDHYPEFSVKTRFENEDYKKITLDNLLRHRGGLQHFSFQTDGISTKGYSFDEFISNIAESWQKYPVNTRFSYSNIGYDLIAFLIQKKSGKKYEEFFKDEIYKPLGMKSSYVGGKSPFLNPNRAIGYEDNLEAKPWIINWPNFGSGAVNSSINDMAKFLRLHFNRGKNAEGQQIISEENITKMVQFPNFDTVKKSGYGLGMGLNAMRFKDILLATHMGDTDSCLAFHRFIPDHKIGILLCINQTNDTPNFMVELTDLGLCELLQQRLGYVPEQDIFQAKFKDHEKQDVSLEDLKNLEGIYVDRFNHAKVHVENNKLVFPYRDFMTPHKTYELSPINPNKFTHPDLPLISFHLFNEKPKNVSVFSKQGKETILDFEEESIPLTKDQLSHFSAYLGDYISDRSDCTRIYACLSEKDGGLHINTLWGMNANLIYHKDNVFYTSEGLVVELHDEKINCDNYHLRKWNLSFDNIKTLYQKEPSHIMFNPLSRMYLIYFLEITEKIELKRKIEALFGDMEDNQ